MSRKIHNKKLSGVQISFRRLAKVGATSKFWLKLTDMYTYTYTYIYITLKY